jgi:hypothetical protein
VTPGDARRARRVELERRRFDEARCSWDFLLHGHDEHAKRCIRTPPCSREYDPGPPPDDERLYEGAALGTLWGLNSLATWQIAGWDITRKKGNA